MRSVDSDGARVRALPVGGRWSVDVFDDAVRVVVLGPVPEAIRVRVRDWVVAAATER